MCVYCLCCGGVCEGVCVCGYCVCCGWGTIAIKAPDCQVKRSILHVGHVSFKAPTIDIYRPSNWFKYIFIHKKRIGCDIKTPPKAV